LDTTVSLMPDSTFDIFISHSKSDGEIASTIKSYLEAAGFKCWKAPENIMFGETWPAAITRALGVCKVMILVWSRNSLSSPEVSKELTIATRNGLTVVPIRIEDIQPTHEWDYHLANTHWMNAFGGSIERYLPDLAEHMAKLLPDSSGRRAKAIAVNDQEDSGSKAAYQGDNFGLLDKLIESAVLDCEVTDDELAIIEERASKLGIGSQELKLLISAKLEQRKQSTLPQSADGGRENAETSNDSSDTEKGKPRNSAKKDETLTAAQKCQKAYEEKGGIPIIGFCLYLLCIGFQPHIVVPTIIGITLSMAYLIAKRIHVGGFLHKYQGKESFREDECKELQSKINDVSTGAFGIFFLVTGAQLLVGAAWTLFVGSNAGTFFMWLFPTGWKALLFYFVPAIIILYCMMQIGNKLAYRLLRKRLPPNVVFAGK
jgi:hypothetical protein